MFNISNFINLFTFNFFFIISGFLFFVLISVSKQHLSFFTVTRFMSVFWSLLGFINFICILMCSGALFNDVLSISSVSWSISQNLLAAHLLFFNLDRCTFFFLLVVCVISVFANCHTLFYMRFDQKKEKFVFLLNAFAFSMVFLVISRNLFLLFLFWELLGVTSFFLIKHNDTQQDSLKSAMKAFSFNKVSDILFVFVLIIYFSITRNFNINNIDIANLTGLSLNYQDFIKFISINLMLLFVFLTACTKSVQIFSYWWLPDSMKAPVPASALIHSATLVTAGFFLIYLFKPLFVHFWGSLFFLIIGSCTFILGSAIAAYQDDLKKTLAYSTIANCGMMLCLLFNFNINLFLIYFLTHGMMKSLSFMFCGEIITLQNHSQDSRTYSSNTYSFFLSLSGLIVSALVLAGLPISIMYIIKHEFMVPTSGKCFWYFFNSLFFLYGFLSILYAINLLTKVFYNYPNSKQNDVSFSIQFLQCGYLNLIYAIIALLTASFLKNLDDFDTYKLNIFNEFTTSINNNSILVFIAWGFILNFLLINYRFCNVKPFLWFCLFLVFIFWLVDLFSPHNDNYFSFFMSLIGGFISQCVYLYIETVSSFIYEFINLLKFYHNVNMLDYVSSKNYTGKVLLFSECPAPEIIREIYTKHIRPYIIWPVIRFTDYLILEPWYWNFSCWLDELLNRFGRFLIALWLKLRGIDESDLD